MKRIFNILGVAAMVAAVVSCSNKEIAPQVVEEETVDDVIFVGSFEQPEADEASKTVMGAYDEANKFYPILWCKNDAIKVWDANSKYAQMTTKVGGANGYFAVTSEVEEGFSEQDAKYAFYPYSAVTAYSNGEITFSIPDQQTYAKNSFGADANYAVSIIQDDEDDEGNPIKVLPFTNVAGALRIQLSSKPGRTVYVKKIVLKDQSKEICGTFTVDAKADKPSAVYTGNGGRTITLNCPTPVALSSDKDAPTSFYFSVPVGAIAQGSGFVAEVYNHCDRLIAELKASNSNGKAVISRAHVTKMNNKECNGLPEGYTEGLSLTSKLEGKASGHTDIYTAGAVINTEVNPYEEEGIRIVFKAKMNDKGSTVTNNPTICGLCNFQDTKTFSPWTGVDWHTGLPNNIRACYSNNGLFIGAALPKTARTIEPFECDATFGPGTNGFTAQFNGGTKQTATVGDLSKLPNAPKFLLFGAAGTANDDEMQGLSASTIYYFKIYSLKTGAMIRDFIPCKKNESNAAGMYDLVNDKFYPCLNGSFSKEGEGPSYPTNLSLDEAPDI